MTDTTPDSPRLPTTSRAVVLGLTALLVWRLSMAAGVARMTLVGAGAGLAVALALWVAGWERWRPVGIFVASLLAGPVSVGVLTVSAGTVALSVQSALPFDSLAVLPTLIVTVLATLFVVVGCGAAVFGAAASTRGVLNRERTTSYATVTNRTIHPLLLVGGVLLASDLASFSGDGSGLLGIQRDAAIALGQLTGLLFDPTPGRSHIAMFCLLSALAAIGVSRAIAALPLTELAPRTSDGPDIVGAIELLVGWLARLGGLLLVVAPVAGVIEMGIDQATVASSLPPAIYELVVGITGLSALRVGLWRLFVASLAVALAVWLLRRTVRSSADRIGTVVAPYVGGAVLAMLVVAVAAPVLSRIRTAITETAPAGTAQLFEQFLVPVLDFFGASTVVVLAAVVVFSTASIVGTGLWLALVTRYVTERTAGVAVAGGGLFVATTAAATLGASTPLVLAGVVGAIVVWDAGAFGVTLRREAGTIADTRRVALVHTGATLAIGGVGAALTVGLTDVATGSITATADAALPGLVACLVALAALSFAIR